MALEIIPAHEAVDYQGLNILVYGPSGAGKTSLAKTVPEDETLIISAEAGLLSIKDLKTDTVTVTGYDDVMEALEIVKSNDKYRWVILDSVSEIAELVLAEEKKACKDGRMAYMNMTDDMLALLKDFRDLPGRNAVFTCKQAYIKDDHGLSMFKPMLPGQQLGQHIPFIFDEVLALRVFEEEGENGSVVSRFLQTATDGKHDAKDRSGALDLFEAPDLAAIEKKILGTL